MPGMSWLFAKRCSTVFSAMLAKSVSFESFGRASFNISHSAPTSRGAFELRDLFDLQNGNQADGKVLRKLANITLSMPDSLAPTEAAPSETLISTSPLTIAWMPSELPLVKIIVHVEPKLRNSPVSLAMIAAAWYGLVAV